MIVIEVTVPTVQIEAVVEATQIGSGGDVTIKDQDGNTVDTVPCGDDYTVLVFSEILDGTPSSIPTDEIVDDPF